MSCLCPFCANYSDVHCQGRGPVDSCPFYAERQSAPGANPGSALPGAKAAKLRPVVSGDRSIIEQKEGEVNGDPTRLLGGNPGEHPV